ncbi:MAG TPA: SDR family NAD(P)-dependent oxidoreductase [Thermoplasmata archaeon]|jgi:3-oxoacyl-[acyl-carrier protein] reductase
MGLEGRAALITGGSRRIGRAIALALGEAGADVAISYRRHATEAREVVRSLEGLGRRSLAIPADFRRPEVGRRLVDRAAERLGHLDILVNNVGEWAVESVGSMGLPTWRRVLDTNLTATFVCSKAAVRHMRRGRWGRIVNLGAAGAYRAHGAAKMSAFYAAKAGIVAFSKALAREVGQYGITVNVVAPGVIKDPQLALEGARRRRDRETAVGRPGTGADIASAVLFLVSDEASFITGDVLGVTGGWLL